VKHPILAAATVLTLNVAQDDMRQGMLCKAA
jgi:hypothetical protein